MESRSISTFGVFNLQNSTLDTVEFEENNRILLRKVHFVFMIPNPSLDILFLRCS